MRRDPSGVEIRRTPYPHVVITLTNERDAFDFHSMLSPTGDGAARELLAAICKCWPGEETPNDE